MQNKAIIFDLKIAFNPVILTIYNQKRVPLIRTDHNIEGMDTKTTGLRVPAAGIEHTTVYHHIVVGTNTIAGTYAIYYSSATGDQFSTIYDYIVICSRAETPIKRISACRIKQSAINHDVIIAEQTETGTPITRNRSAFCGQSSAGDRHIVIAEQAKASPHRAKRNPTYGVECSAIHDYTAIRDIDAKAGPLFIGNNSASCVKRSSCNSNIARSINAITGTKRICDLAAIHIQRTGTGNRKEQFSGRINPRRATVFINAAQNFTDTLHHNGQPCTIDIDSSTI